MSYQNFTGSNDTFLPIWTNWKNKRKMTERIKKLSSGSGDAGPSTNQNASKETINDKDHLIKRFENLYNNETFSDIVLKVGETSYHAHKLVLITASEVFEAMLGEDRWKESMESVVCLTEEDCCVPVFSYFLKYLYCGTVDVNTESVLPILLLADKYGIKQLCESCVGYMMQHIVESPDTNRTLSWYQYAKMTNNEILQQKCCKYILSNFTIVQHASDWLVLSLNEMTEFLMSSEIVVISEYNLWEEVERWLMYKHNQDSLVGNLRAVLPLIRFSLMSPLELAAIEESPLYHEHKGIFGDRIWQAYRRHSLMYEDIVSIREPYRNYICLSAYSIYCDLILRNYMSKQKVDSRITVENFKIPAHFMPKPLQLHSKQFTFMVDFYPKGFYKPHVLYAQYIGHHTEETMLKIRRCKPTNPLHPTQLPDMVTDITLLIYGMKGKVQYAAHTFNAKHTFSAEDTKFEETCVIPLSKLTEQKSNYLVNGHFEARLFLKIQELKEHKENV